MGKLQTNKQQKLTSLLNTAFELFTSKGVNKTSIAEIAENAGIAKGTFYLYFKDKYDIRNMLIAHESDRLFKEAVEHLHAYNLSHETELPFEDTIIFIIDDILNELDRNRKLLTFISKNLSWGIFKKALTTGVSENDVDFLDVFNRFAKNDKIRLRDPEIVLFLIIELVSSVSYSAILYGEPTNLEGIKPHLYKTIRRILKDNEIHSRKKVNEA